MIETALQGFTTDFHFLRPFFLLALIPALLLGLFLTFLQGQNTQWSRSIDPALLPFLLDKTHTPKENLPVFGLLAIWVLSTLALAGPVWQQLPIPVQENEDALIVVMDLSMSMYADDLAPNRITRARRKMVDILNQRSNEGQTALVVYAGDAHAVTPITDDVDTISNLIPALDPNIMPNLGSNPEAGIQLALDLLKNSGIEKARILLMTDGIKTSDISAISTLINNSSHQLVILGVGTEDGAPIPTAEGGFLRDQNNAIVIPRLERRLLQELSDNTGGRYADAQISDDDVNFLLAQGIFEENENLQETEQEFDSWYEVGPWLLLLILPIAALAFRQGWLLCIPLLILLSPAQPAQAFEWNDLWKNKDQQGNEAFQNERYETAAEEFKDPAWKAASNYRRGRFEDAANEYAQFDDPTSHYNRGNALANLMRLEEAIAAYDLTLAAIPDHVDALKNKAIVEELLENQEQDEQNQQESDDQQQQQQNQDQQDQQQDQENQEQQQSSEQSGDQENQEPQDQEGEQDQDQQNQEEGEQDPNEQEPQDPQDFQGQQPNSEEEQSMQQWLGRIKDDPGELLRNKFRQQSQKQLYEQLQNPGLARERAQEQVW